MPYQKNTVFIVAAMLSLAIGRATAETIWTESPEGVALEFIAALDNLDLKRIMTTQDDDATMYFPHPNAKFRLENKREIETAMTSAFENAKARANQSGIKNPPYLRLPQPENMRVQFVTENAAVVTWMFDRPGSFGRRSATMRNTEQGWRMINFHSSNLLYEQEY